MSTEENRTITRRFFEEVFNQRKAQVIDELLSADYQHHDSSLPPEFQHGLQAYKQVLPMFLSAFPDLHGTIEDLLAEGDKVAARLTWQGTHDGALQGIPPTGRKVSFSMILIHRVAGGKCVEGWVNWDAMGMMQQLGVIPSPEQVPA